jgi:hypothetical protein
MKAGSCELSLSCGAALVLACSLFTGGVRADDRHLYETRRMERAARARSFQIDPAPAGKRIAFVEVAREDVFVEDEVWPVWPNLFHWLTDDDVVRRELLFAPGDAYDEARIEESMRNLRAVGVFALVRIVAVRTPDPDSVGILVYTRDLWSLRLETAFIGTGDAFRMAVQLAERNLFGRRKLLSARFAMDPKAFSLGQAYVDPRVFDGELALQQYFDVIFNRESGETEGSRGMLSLSQPFRYLHQRWAFSTSASYANQIERKFDGADIATYREGDSGQPVFCRTPDPACLRAVYRDETYGASLSGSHQRGDTYRQRFSLGVAFGERVVAAVPETALEPGEEESFERLLLPRARREVYPHTSYSLWLPDFVVLHNLSTFGKSENIRVGPSLAASVALPLEAFGSSTNSVRFSGELGYVIAGSDALAEASVSAGARLEEGRVIDQRGSAVVRGATPQWLLGRMVVFGSWDLRRRDSARTQITLGGDNGLRGYPSAWFQALGGNRVRANVEYRTQPWVFEAVHLGGVLFYDAGTVYTKLSRARMHHGAGAGLRLLFPHFNQSPFRLDFGVPLDEEGFSVQLSYGSSQAVPLTSDDDAASTGAL